MKHEIKTIKYLKEREYLKLKMSDNLLPFSIEINKYTGFIFNKNNKEKKTVGFGLL